MRRVRELDGLRAIAIVMVIGCHYQGFAGLLGGLPELGWLGVDVFFALSGYLITSILLGLRGKKNPLKTFYSRRAVRIFPPYVAALILTGLLCVLSGHVHALTPMVILRQVFFLQGFHAECVRSCLNALQHLPFHLTHLQPLGRHAHELSMAQRVGKSTSDSALSSYWSLSVEEYFYIFWAPIVLIFSRKWIVTLGVFVCGMEIMLRWIDGTATVYFDAQFRQDALLYGAFLALLLERWRGKQIPQQVQGLLLGVFAAGIAGLGWMVYELHPVVGRELRQSPLWLTLGLPVFSITASAAIGLLVVRAEGGGLVPRLLRSRPFQVIGTISYAMYLFHLMAAYVVGKGADYFHVTLGGAFLQALLSLLLTVLVARLSWHFLEKPLLRWKDARFPSSPHPPEPALR